MSLELTTIDSGEVIPTFCQNCKADLRKVGMHNHYAVIFDYEYNDLEKHFEGTEIPRDIENEYYCSSCNHLVPSLYGHMDCKSEGEEIEHKHDFNERE